jgi:hypothetical protein
MLIHLALLGISVELAVLCMQNRGAALAQSNNQSKDL